MTTTTPTRIELELARCHSLIPPHVCGNGILPHHSHLQCQFIASTAATNTMNEIGDNPCPEKALKKWQGDSDSFYGIDFHSPRVNHVLVRPQHILLQRGVMICRFSRLGLSVVPDAPRFAFQFLYKVSLAVAHSLGFLSHFLINRIQLWSGKQLYF